MEGLLYGMKQCAMTNSQMLEYAFMSSTWFVFLAWHNFQPTNHYIKKSWTNVVIFITEQIEEMIAWFYMCMKIDIWIN